MGGARVYHKEMISGQNRKGCQLGQKGLRLCGRCQLIKIAHSQYITYISSVPVVSEKVIFVMNWRTKIKPILC